MNHRPSASISPQKVGDRKPISSTESSGTHPDVDYKGVAFGTTEAAMARGKFTKITTNFRNQVSLMSSWIKTVRWSTNEHSKWKTTVLKVRIQIPQPAAYTKWLSFTARN